MIQQQQLADYSLDSCSRSSYYDSSIEELNSHLQCFCSISDNCNCNYSSESESDYSSDIYFEEQPEPAQKQPKQKVLMAQTKDDELKIFSQI